MTDESSATDWTTISIPRDAADQVRDVYQTERIEVRFGKPEPLWAFVLRAVCRIDEG